MRKFLSLFAAVLVALVANAAVINITNANADALRLALNSAQTGDIIEMAAGTYVESNSNYIAFAGKEVTVRAAEGAEVLIQPKVSVTLSEGAKARFENIKFDVSHLIELASWYEHLIYPTDATENRLELEGCEFYGFNLNKSMIYCSSSNKLSAITVNNCYFHDCMKSLIFVESTADMNAQIKNSTFANISTNTESYWAGVIDIRATGATLLVDHCTFYNVIPMNTDYSCVSKVTLANGVASNCIFMLPTAQDGIRAMRGVTANNCITFNYLNDSGTGIHSSVTKNNCVQVDPLFVDAANGDFTLGEGSPALTMNDGQPIGDPRWIPSAEPVVEPELKTKTLYCKVAQDWWKADGAAVGVYAYGDAGAQNAAWPGVRMTAVEGAADTWTADIDVDLYHTVIFTRVNASGDIADWGAKTGDLQIPADKDLYTITSATEVWGDPGVAGEWSKYAASEPVEPTLANGFYLNGSHAEWAVANLTAELKFEPTEENPAEYKLTTTLTEGQEIKVVKVEADAIVAWYPAEGGNYVVDAAHAGENKDIYFKEAYQEDWAAFGGHIWTGANEEPQPTKYCEFATGHLKDANFGDANGRILLTIQKIADSNNIRVAIKNNAAAGNTKAGLNYLWVNATGAKNNNATYGSHEAEDVEEVSVIVEFDEAQESYVFNNIHWAYAGWGGEWAIDGLTVSAAELCEASTPIVEVTYYMKNNWDAGADWTWKAMTKDGETYKLEKVVFGGTGVNYNTAESDEGSQWVALENIGGAAIAAKDTVTFVLDPAAGTVTATLIGKYVDPNPGEHTYTVAGNLTAAFGTAWDPENTANDMEMNDDGIYVWEKTELTLAAGSIGFKVCEDHAWTVAYPANDYQLAIPEAGIYTIWIHFDPANGNAVTAGATKTGDATVTVDYYLVGSAKGWEAKAENIFTLNAEAGEGIEEYKIETTLEVGEGLKVLSSTGVWYPDGMGNEYVVDQDHAGATTIYFRPAGNAEWEAFGGFMYVVPTGGAGIDAVDANAPAVKVLRNGQILIKKGDKTYNIMGAIVR